MPPTKIAQHMLSKLVSASDDILRNAKQYISQNGAKTETRYPLQCRLSSVHCDRMRKERDARWNKRIEVIRTPMFQVTPFIQAGASVPLFCARWLSLRYNLPSLPWGNLQECHLNSIACFRPFLTFRLRGQCCWKQRASDLLTFLE